MENIGEPAADPKERSKRRDRTIIFAANTVRSVATGLTGVILGIYLQRLHFSPSAIGIVIAAGLAGGAAAAILATIAADRLGRRRFLVAVSLACAIGGAFAALISSVLAMTVVAFFGMLNGMGRDRGASSIIDQAILPATAPDHHRTRTFAIYSVLQAAGAAAGALMAGLPTILDRHLALGGLLAMRFGIGAYATLMVMTALLYLGLTREVELHRPEIRRPISPETVRIITRLSALFALDSIGGGFLTQALVAYFFVRRFGVSPAEIGLLFFVAATANALSQLAAPLLARRIGLVNTMVFTHIPGNLLMMAVAFAPSFHIAAILFLMRESLVQMDVPARNSYVMAVVGPQERTFASGITGLVRLGGWAVAPGFAGIVMQSVSLTTPFIAGPALKLVYDLLLYRAFSGIRPPEEMVSTAISART